MEDDEKKRRKSPYELKEEFPDTINIKPKDEQSEAPAVEAPAEEASAEETSEAPAPETTQTQTTAAENAEPTEVTPTEKEVSPAPTTEGTAVEKTDGQDVDGETGVVSQKTGDDNERTPLPEMPEQGDTSALQGKVETEQQPSGIDLSKREYGENPETEARNRQFVNNADELEKPDESALSPLTQPKEGIDLSKREYPTDGDLTPEQVVSKYGGDAERLKEAGFNPDGTPLSVGDEDNDESALPQPPAIPKAEDDETVKGIEQANATRDKAWSDYINFYEDFLKKQEEYDRQRQERDSRNAFWRSIGEVGASLVNLLGVSGAFSGRNAYGRGAYSSMQKFDLTTSKLTDKMWADIDKRKERMDELKQKMMENKLKWQEVVAGGQEKGGTAKGAAADKQYTREYTRYKDQATAGESARQFDETMKEKKREFDVTNQTNKEIAALNNNTKLYLANYEQNGKTENKLVDWTFNIDGEPRTLRARAGSLYKVFETTSTRLADEIAKTMGFDNYERYKRVLEGIDSKDKDTKADSQNELEDMRRRYIRSNVSGATVKFDDEGNITGVDVPEGTSEAAKADALAVAEKYAEMWNDHISRLEGYENAKSEIDWDGSMTGSNKNFVTNWVMDAGPYYNRYGQYVADFLETQAAILGESNDPDENGFV